MPSSATPGRCDSESNVSWFSVCGMYDRYELVVWLGGACLYRLIVWQQVLVELPAASGAQVGLS